MTELRRRFQVRRAPERDQGERRAYRWRVTVARPNRRPTVAEGVVFATRDGIAAATGPRASREHHEVVGMLVKLRGLGGQFPERLDLHEAPRPDPAAQRPPPLSHRRGESGLGLGALAERARRNQQR